MTVRLRIWLDPRLTATHAPEIAWAWKTVLTSAGIPWEQVTEVANADVIYIVDPETVLGANAALTIRADAARWTNPADSILTGTERHSESRPDGGDAFEWHTPLFARDTPTSPPIVARESNRWSCDRDLVFDIYWFLTRQVERTAPRALHGQPDLTGSPLLEDNTLHKAVASSIIARLGQLLAHVYAGVPTPRWPNGMKAAACASHDVDYPEIIRWLEPLRIVRRNGVGSLGTALGVALGQRTHWQFEAWIAAESALRTKSAFYFVPRQGSLREYASGTPDPFYDVASPRFAKSFRNLTDAGFEVGLHASFLAYQSAERFGAEKERLARVSGQAVDGCRHHYWHLDPQDSEKTLLVHEQVGLRYDASISLERHVGWRAGTNVPYNPFIAAERRAIATVQLPTGYMDDQLFGYRALNGGDRQSVLDGLLRTVVAHGGMMMVDVHDYVLDDVLFPLWGRTYLDFWARVAADSEIWIALPREVAAHWTGRRLAIEAASSGL